MSSAHQPPKPQPATTMSAPQSGDHAVQALATSIYIQLVKEAVVIDATHKVSVSADPAALAKLSYVLAESFIDTGEAIKASAKPKTEVFDVNKMDFGI